MTSFLLITCFFVPLNFTNAFIYFHVSLTLIPLFHSVKWKRSKGAGGGSPSKESDFSARSFGRWRELPPKKLYFRSENRRFGRDLRLRNVRRPEPGNRRPESRNCHLFGGSSGHHQQGHDFRRKTFNGRGFRRQNWRPFSPNFFLPSLNKRLKIRLFNYKTRNFATINLTPTITNAPINDYLNGPARTYLTHKALLRRLDARTRLDTFTAHPLTTAAKIGPPTTPWATTPKTQRETTSCSHNRGIIIPQIPYRHKPPIHPN